MNDMKCKKCGDAMQWLPGRPAHISNLYCERCDYPNDFAKRECATELEKTK